MDIVKTETKSDYVGTYTAYTYTDGHVETNPVSRPKYKEDVQLKRTLTAGASPSQLIRPFSSAVFALSKFANTVGSSNNNALLFNVPIGGRVVGEEAGKRAEFA